MERNRYNQTIKKAKIPFPVVHELVSGTDQVEITLESHDDSQRYDQKLDGAEAAEELERARYQHEFSDLSLNIYGGTNPLRYDVLFTYDAIEGDMGGEILVSGTASMNELSPYLSEEA